ncbi:transposase [Pseudomonas sp. dw_358]|uniref:REP-associated tyrosine transposase n=1 Tax=Pseudomonas sp. dw_358 TaxID=2720083 RepID=UPI001BD37FCF|nr:transposase [Pseudomonas sp. dw_358]
MPGDLKSHGLRKFRCSEVSRVYLVTVVTNYRTRLFVDWMAGRPVVEAFRAAEHDGEVQSLCWVVMPDHIHWLMTLRAGSLSSVVGRMKSRSTLWVNRQMGHEGQIWQRGFHDRALRREEDLQAVARYVVNNPVRAGLVKSVREYSLWDAIWV